MVHDSWDPDWHQFILYSRSVITAHFISANPEVEGKWAGMSARDKEDPEVMEWVISCREGRLHYSPLGCTVYHIEWWQYTAQDVTYVNANADDYKDFYSSAHLTHEETNELLYSLTYGSMFSKKFPSEEVRAGLMKGELPGDRIILLASKS